MTIYDELSAFGMLRFASVSVGQQAGGRFFRVDCSSPLANGCFGIYAFVVGDCIVRVGKAEQSLKGRMQYYSRSVTTSLRIRDLAKPSTPYWEADLWWDFLTRCGPGVVYGKVGSVVDAGFGPMNIFEAEERILIMRYSPVLNSARELDRTINWFPV